MLDFATIIVNGQEVFSYRGESGRILSPSTMPWALWPYVAQAAGHPEVSTLASGIGYNPYEQSATEEIEPHVFRKTVKGHVTVGVRLGPNHTSYIPEDGAKDYEVTWVGISDYRD